MDESVDINEIILRERNADAPETYMATFEGIFKERVINLDLFNEIKESVGLRNRIVHRYEFVQKVKSVNDINSYLKPYEEYLKIITSRFIS